jgi:hypothetical protein
VPDNDRMPARTSDDVAPITRGGRGRIVAVAALLVVLYAGLAVAYAIGGSATVDQSPVDVPDGGVEVLLTVRSIDAASPDLVVDVGLVLSDSLVDDAGRPIRPVTLTLEPTTEDLDLTYGSDRRPSIRQVKIPFDGDIEQWPFDSYTTTIVAYATVGEGDAAAVVPTVVSVQGQVQGWQLAAAPDADAPDLADDLTFHRSLAIVLFGLTLVSVLILLPITTWIVGWKLYREDRLFEAGFLGWIGAMLFATIPIRNFFPGSPPPGSWVDVLVTLWVIVALAVVLLVGLAAFIKNPRRNH